MLAVLARKLLASDTMRRAVARRHGARSLAQPFLISLLGLPLTGEERQLVDATPMEERRRRLPASLRWRWLA